MADKSHGEKMTKENASRIYQVVAFHLPLASTVNPFIVTLFNSFFFITSNVFDLKSHVKQNTCLSPFPKAHSILKLFAFARSIWLFINS